MFTPQSDPLGVGVQQRARDNRFKLAAQGLLPAIGPLPDPQWEGYFQAEAERNPGKTIRYGEDNPSVDDTYTDPDKFAEQQKAMNQLGPQNMPLMGPSRQLGTIPGSVMESLRRLRKGQQ